MCFFFFKQKTAYEVRISDCSSDVCSSDLQTDSPPITTRTTLPVDAPNARRTPISRTRCVTRLPSSAASPADASTSASTPSGVNRLSTSRVHALARQRRAAKLPTSRSEEHTSELQSLLRISYAVFCLKQKTTRKTKNIT